jgi:hypothetical protein
VSEFDRLRERPTTSIALADGLVRSRHTGDP